MADGINTGSFVVTSKGNYGKVVSISGSIAKVRIGMKTHDIELYNLTNVTNGTHVKVKYTEKSSLTKGETLIFVKHNSVIFDSTNPQLNNDFLLKITDAIQSKVSKEVLVDKIIIP